MPHSYDEFVHLQNIRHFEKKLETETDPENRDMLRRLLAEEKTKILQPTNSRSAKD
ncbi:hypothetical protein SAMN02927914_05944 [Mesorhizobium qingshengii]|uniref:Uncharacterized protein n=1 Tax=Mesorhizobium qingshengii TaxID=1165689 RepID=A0A1G5ZSB3_9HYPH|nr:hypothetical protein SAMN02927914_05944 [Mesorhizobium qingshengii]